MKFSVEKSDLAAGLQAVQNVVGTRSILPILANVLITAESDAVYLCTTDLDVSVRCKPFFPPNSLMEYFPIFVRSFPPIAKSA